MKIVQNTDVRIQKAQLFLLLILGIFFCSTFYNRYIQSDENWVAEQAYWLVEEGEVKIKGIPGIFNWDSHFLIYHKLFVWIVASIYAVFGWSLFIFKTYTLLVFVGAILIVTKYFLKQQGNKGFIFLPAIVFLSTPLMIVKGFELRPEVTLMFLGFLSFFFLERSRERKTITMSCLAGFFAGLAFLAHLNGLIFCVAGFFYLIYFKEIKSAIIYTLSGALIGSIYFLPLLNEQLFHEWLNNLKNWPSHNYEENLEGNGIIGILGNYLTKLASEHKRYFWDFSIISISILFLSTLAIMFKSLWSKYKGLILYTLFSLFFLALLGSSKSPRYLIFFMPFIVLVVSFGFTQMITIKTKFSKILVCFLLTISAFQLVSAAVVVEELWSRSYNYKQRNSELLASIPKGSKVLGPWELIFTDISNYQLYNYKTYEYLQEKRDTLFTQKEVLMKAYSFGMEYIVVYEKVAQDNEFGWFRDLKFQEDNPYYKLLLREKDFLILKRKS